MDRVKNALSSVSNRVSSEPLPVPPPPPVFPSSPSIPGSPNKKRRSRKKKDAISQDGEVVAHSNESIPDSHMYMAHENDVPTSSNVTIKKRFKHRSLLTGHADNKKPKPGLEQISENYAQPTPDNQCTSIIPRSTEECVSSAAMYPTSTSNIVKVVPVSTQSPLHNISSSCSSDVSATPRLHMPQLQNLCPFCKSSYTTCVGSNLFKCMNCIKQYMPLQIFPRRSSIQGGANSATFYGVPQGSPARMLSPAPTKKRAATGRATGKNVKKKKQAETIDLVSSDEEEKQTNDDTEHVTTSATTSNSSSTTVSAPVTESSRIADRMRLPGGALPERTNTPTPPPAALPSPSQQPSPSPSPAPMENLQGEYKFHCNKAMFGELYGHTLAPTRVAENRIYLSLECIIHRDQEPITEKYTLSVGQNDVQQVLVYFGRVPSFVAIETANRFAEVACRRIGRDVLVPGALDPKKRYIILALISAFKNDNEAAVEVGHLITCISNWAQITLLSHEEAQKIITQANLDVSQQEICYGNPAKPTGPVETLLIYPVPPRTGGIPVTTEDVACLAESIYLNDIIIDFYLKYIYEGVLTPKQKERTYVFNSYFYKRLTQKQGSRWPPDQMHAQVKKWTRNVDIFEKDFIVIPVNEHCHWYLVVICFPGKLLADSQDLNEKDEEEEDDEIADFIKETNPAVEISDPKKENDQLDKSVVDGKSESSLIEAKKEIAGDDQNVAGDDQNVETKSLDTKTTDPESASGSKLTDGSSEGERDNKTASSDSAGDAAPIKKESSQIESEVAGEETLDKTVNPVIPEKIVYKQAYDSEDFDRPCILIFDSLVGSGHARVFTNLRNYLTEEWSSRKCTKQPRVFDKSNMKGCYPKIPRQNNDCDCGVFLLQYAESFFKQPIKSFRMPVHLESWFTHEFVSGKRQRIKDLIEELASDYKSKR